MYITGNITASEYADYIYIGSFTTAKVGNIDLGNDYDTVITGYDVDATIGNVSGVGYFEIGSGVSSDDKAIVKVSDIAGTQYDDVISVGDFMNVTIGDIDFKEGYNNIYTGYDADVTFGNISGVGYFGVGDGVSSENEANIEAKDITGTQYDDVFAFGNYTDVEFDNLTFGEGNDYIGNGIFSEIEASGKIDFGAGYDSMFVNSFSRAEAGALDFGADYDVLTLGYKSELILGKNVENVEAIYADVDTKIIVKDTTADVSFKGVEGTWQNATIYDLVADTLNKGDEIIGNVYGNEWDVYKFTAAETKLRLAPDSNNVDVKLFANEGGVWTEIANDRFAFDNLTVGSEYAVMISVDNAGYTDETKKSYNIKIA